MKARSKLHKHICMKCSTRAKPTVWEHDAPECFVPGTTEKNCPKCAGGDDSPKDFWHDHHCGKHDHMWDHADKACLLGMTRATTEPEMYELDCPGQGPGKAGSSTSSESGGTAQMSRPKIVTCPKCDTNGAKQIADAGGLTGHDEYVCMKCGYEFAA